MFDIGFWEVAIIGVIMLLVLGPERLPGVARTAGFWLGKFRRSLNQIKAEIKQEMDAAELKDLKDVKDQINHAKTSFKEKSNQIKQQLENDAQKISENVKKESSKIEQQFEKKIDSGEGNNNESSHPTSRKE